MAAHVTSRVVTLLTGGALCLCGVWVMYWEAAPNLRGNSTALTRALAYSEAPGPVGLSNRTQREELLSCEQSLRSAAAVELLYLPDGSFEKIVNGCASMAGSILSSNSGNSLAWLVRAQSAAKSSDLATLNYALEQSWLTAPNELWLARMRLNLVVAADYQQLSAANADRFVRDIAVVGADYPMALELAQLYLAHTDLRPQVQAALPLMAPQDQREFLDVLRASVNPAAGS